MALIPQLQKTDPLPNFSRWVSLDFLLDLSEMEMLLKELEPSLLLSSTPMGKNNPFYLEKKTFLEAYSYYISKLKNQKIPEISRYKSLFYFFITQDLENIYRHEVIKGREVLKIYKPTLLVKPISLQYSKVDHSVRVGPLNPNGILWGLQVSFPQLMQEGGSPDIKTINPQVNENANLFKTLRRWIRAQTKPVSFKVQNEKIILPIRLGKNCSCWISKHPQLALQPELNIM